MLSILYLILTVTIGLSVAAAQDVSLAAFQDLNLFAQYSAAAYFATTFPEDSKMMCSAGNELVIPDERVFIEGIYKDTTLPGFLVVDLRNRLTTLSFQGDSNIVSRFTEDDLTWKEIGVCHGCRIAARFWTLWQEVHDEVMSDMKRIISSYPHNRLVITGHNSGGSVATLAAAILSESVPGRKAELFTYGSLRVGNEAFADYVSSNVDVYRVTHKADVIPLLPGRSLGFRHPSPEYFITSDNERMVTESDIRVIEEADSATGNGQYAVMDASWADNKWYFGNIDAGKK